MILVLMSITLFAAGQKKLDVPLFHAPDPRRIVFVPPIEAGMLLLPGNVVADISIDVRDMLLAAISTKTHFDPSDTIVEYEAGKHLELRASITDFSLSNDQMGLHLTMRPLGSLSQLVNFSTLTGSVKITIGQIMMAFSLWECVNGSCVSTVASRASSHSLGSQLNFDVNFGMIQTGADFVHKTVLGNVLTKIMDRGMVALAADAIPLALPWQASLQSYDEVTGIVVFDAGNRAEIRVGDMFEIYRKNNDIACQKGCILELLALFHVLSVQMESSIGRLDSLYSTKKPAPGDRVFIHICDK